MTTTTYSFAFDFPNYYFSADPLITDGTEMFVIKSSEGIPLYLIKAVNFMQVEKQDAKTLRYGQDLRNFQFDSWTSQLLNHVISP